MGPSPILPVKLAVTIDTVLNFEGHCDSDWDGVGTCKHTIRPVGTFLYAILGPINLSPVPSTCACPGAVLCEEAIILERSAKYSKRSEMCNKSNKQCQCY